MLKSIKDGNNTIHILYNASSNIVITEDESGKFSSLLSAVPLERLLSTVYDYTRKVQNLDIEDMAMGEKALKVIDLILSVMDDVDAPKFYVGKLSKEEVFHARTKTLEKLELIKGCISEDTKYLEDIKQMRIRCGIPESSLVDLEIFNTDAASEYLDQLRKMSLSISPHLPINPTKH